jgi:hypothetical protein
VNYRDYGDTLFERGKSSFVPMASEFQTIAEENQAEPDPFGTPIRIDTPPDFQQDTSFGLMAKHAIAWAAVVEALLSDSQFLSLPHALEAREELNCSVLLAKNLYYKQALQALRSLLEINVLHLFFAGNPAAYADWQKGQETRWTLRGSGGLLEALQKKGALPPSVAGAASDLYKDLNKSIHSAESKMLHTGLPEGKWAGLQFKTETFVEWCTYLTRVVSVSISLLLAMLREMQSLPAPNGVVCNVCRAVNQFDVEERTPTSFTLRCLRCGCQSSFSPEYVAQFGFS